MNAIYWLRNDLRLHDNHTFWKACEEADEVIPVYIFNSQEKKTSSFRTAFLQESLLALRAQLLNKGKDLYICQGDIEEIFTYLQQELNTNRIYISYEYAHDEKQEVTRLRNHGFEVLLVENHTLTSKSLLPFHLDQLPDVFTDFRKQVESKNTFLPIAKKINLSRCLSDERIANLKYTYILPSIQVKRDARSAISFTGGEQEGLKRLHYYLHESHAIKNYKQTRNELVGPDYSTKFSPWLSAGCLSARKIYVEVKAYEEKYGANESTYWVIFELLWRDYFKYVADRYGKSFFLKGGLHHSLYDTSVGSHFDKTIFEKWKQGQTGNDFVDANMVELLNTGFMSNRGRQNVASFLVNDLKIDWRYGAAWFEEMLIDYDVCSNWGNWLYLAGVGNDPRKNRYFNTMQQAERYDANGAYRKRWLGR